MSIDSQLSSTCPMCKSSKLITVEKIQPVDLISLYRKQLSIEVNGLISEVLEISYIHCDACDLRFFLPIITGDEEFYNALQRYDWYYVDTKDEYSFAAKYIGNADKVLDIGSGKGAFAKYLQTPHFTGLEFSVEARALAQENQVHVINESIQDHALNNQEAYDTVTSFQVLEHVSDLNGFIASAITCVRPGGYLILAVPSYDSFLRYVVNGVLNLPPHHVSHWSDQALENISKLWGLEVVELHHEQVAPCHKQWQLETFYTNKLRTIFGMSKKLVDFSIGSKIVKRLTHFCVKNENKPNFENDFSHGHTVIIVFKKTVNCAVQN